MLKFKNYSDEEILEAVNKNGEALQFVIIKSENILNISTVFRKEYEEFLRK